MSTYIPSVLETVIGMIGLIVCICLLAHLKKPRPACYDDQLQRRHRRIREQQLGEAYRDGYTLPQMLYAMASLGGALLFIPAAYFIVIAVMGASEPRW